MLRSSTELKKFVSRQLLAPASEETSLFNRQSVQMLLAHHWERKGNYAEIIGRVLTIEFWHRLFVEPVANRESYEHALLY